VQLSYTYAEEFSNHTFDVTVTDHSSQATASTSTFNVADAALTGTTTATATGGVEGTHVATLVGATFADANHGAPFTDFTTSIDWGDGNTHDTISGSVSGSGGSYSIAGTHQYA